MPARWTRAMALVVLCLLACVFIGCDSGVESDDQSSGAIEYEDITIIVTANATDTRVSNARVVVDNGTPMYTSAGGTCEIELARTNHTVEISKSGYKTLKTSFNVTSQMSSKYFTIYSL